MIDCIRLLTRSSEAMDSTSASAIPSHPDDNNDDSKQPMTDFTLINAEGFAPFVLHERHNPVPIVMVNRAAHGSTSVSLYSDMSSADIDNYVIFLAPGHQDVDVPQNVAWLSGIRLAQKSIYMCVPSTDTSIPPV